MMEYVLQTNVLSKKYANTNVVNKVSMNVAKGDIYGFIGKNGAGKTTLMKMVCGLTAPSAGEIKLFDSKELDKQRKRIGCVIEQPALYSSMTAKEHLRYYNKIMGMPNDKNITELLELVGLGNTGKKKTGKFSMGMKQRLSIAIALLAYPDFLILDEPVNGLDPTGIKEIRDLLIKLNEEWHITILISSHILGELSKMATRYGVIDNGSLIEEFTAKELEDRCKVCIQVTVDDIKKAAFVLEKNLGSRDYKVSGKDTLLIYDLLDRQMEINRCLIENHVEVKSICMDGDDLEAYFIKLMGGKQHD